MSHSQTFAAVNAKVDIGVVQLVEALSRFPGLVTMESCQGNEDGAFVCFQYGTGWRSLSEFVFSFLAPELSRRVSDDAAVIVRYSPDNGNIMADLTVRPGATDRVSVAVSQIASAFPDAVARRVAMAGLAQGKGIAQDGLAASSEMMDMPFASQDRSAAARVVSASLHRTFTVATSALVEIISECHAVFASLPYCDSFVAPNS